MILKHVSFLTLAISAIAQSGAQSAGKDESQLDPIIVTGSRLGQNHDEIGSSLSVITAKDIETIGAEFAIEALASVPGVTLNSNGAFGGQANVRIRGAASEQTLVLIDGVPVTDPSSPGGGYDFARLDTQTIDEIEVLKGPHSTLWGSDAIGGVVSITTKKPKPGKGGSAFGEFGSFDTFRAGASVHKSGDAGDVRLSMLGGFSEGISKADADNGNSETDGYDALTLSAKGGLNLGETARVSANLLWINANTEYDSFVFGAQGNVGDGNELSKTEEMSGNVSFLAKMFDDTLQNQLLIGYSDISRNNFTNYAPSFDAKGERVVFRYQGTLDLGPRNTLAFGTEYEDISANDESTKIGSIFGIYEFKPFDVLTLTGGLRVDDHTRFGAEPTGRFAAAYQATDYVTLRASWGQGFKAPTLFQTTFFCCGAIAANAELTPESSKAIDFGLEWRSDSGRAELGLTYFDQDIENQIDFSFARGGYENIDQVHSQGLEIFGRFLLVDGVDLTANYTRIDAETGDGTSLVRIPKHSGDVRLAYDPAGPLSAAIMVRYNGQETNSDGSKLEAWTRVDITGRYALTERVEIYGRIENLLNEDYQQVLGYGTPDLSARIGLRVRL